MTSDEAKDIGNKLIQLTSGGFVEGRIGVGGDEGLGVGLGAG